MKVAVLSTVAWRTPPQHYGPWEQMASNLTEGLVDSGLEVTLFATGDSVTRANLNSVVDTGYAETPGQDAKVLECLHISNLMERAAEFDLIHNHFDFLPLSYTRLIKTPVITTIHGFSSEKIIPVYQKYNRDTHYVSISEANRHPKLSYLATVYNGLNLANFEFNENAGDYLLFFGRIHPDKGTAEAIQIALRSKRKLIIAGIVQDENYFRERVEPFLNEDIVFKGAAGPAERNNLLRDAFCLLHPISFEEPFGLSVAEAQLCGTPVIAFNKGSMPELIMDRQTGFLVENIEEAIERLQDVRNIRRKDCCTWATHKFSKEKMVEDYIDLYHRILNY